MFVYLASSRATSAVMTVVSVRRGGLEKRAARRRRRRLSPQKSGSIPFPKPVLPSSPTMPWNAMDSSPSSPLRLPPRKCIVFSIVRAFEAQGVNKRKRSTEFPLLVASLILRFAICLEIITFISRFPSAYLGRSKR